MKIQSLTLAGLLAVVFMNCSCSSSEDEVTLSETQSGISFVAGMPGVTTGTRTSFDVVQGQQGNLKYTPLWSPNENLTVLYSDNLSADYKGTNAGYANKAQFEYQGSDNPIVKGNTIVATNKALTLSGGGFISAANTRGIEIGGEDEKTMEDSYANGFLAFPFKSDQVVNAGQKIDEQSEILVSKPVLVSETTPNPIPLAFKRYNAIIRVNISAKGDQKYPLSGHGIKQIQLTTENADDDFGGDVKINVQNETIEKLRNEKVTVKAAQGSSVITSVGSADPAYMSVLPTTIKKGSTFKIYFITVDGRTYGRLLTARDGDIVIEAGKVVTFNVSFGDNDLKVIMKHKN